MGEANVRSQTAFRVGQVRVIFSFTEQGRDELIKKNTHLKERIPSRLAYVEWFTKFPCQPASNFRMYKVSRSFEPDGSRTCDIIPVSSIERSVHLIPNFGERVRENQEWTSTNVLEKCSAFFVNDFKDRSTHFSLY